MKLLNSLAAVATLCASIGCPPADAQGTGASPYGTSLGRPATAPSSHRDQRKQGATAGARARQGASAAKEASAPRANAAEDTDAQ